MIVQLENEIKDKTKEAIIEKVKELKYKPNEVSTQKGHYLVGTGKGSFDPREIGHMDGIQDIHVSPYWLRSVQNAASLLSTADQYYRNLHCHSTSK